MRLINKTCVITAAAQGIGQATALAFARECAQVIATDINLELLNELKAQSDNIIIEYLDITDKDQVIEFSKKYQNVDVLFNCAGWVPAGTILECNQEQWDRAFKINVDSMYHMISAFLRAMLKKGKASIINMSSAASSIKGVPNRFSYSVTKAAVLGMTNKAYGDAWVGGLKFNMNF